MFQSFGFSPSRKWAGTFWSPWTRSLRSHWSIWGWSEVRTCTRVDSLCWWCPTTTGTCRLTHWTTQVDSDNCCSATWLVTHTDTHTYWTTQVDSKVRVTSLILCLLTEILRGGGKDDPQSFAVSHWHYPVVGHPGQWHQSQHAFQDGHVPQKMLVWSKSVFNIWAVFDPDDVCVCVCLCVCRWQVWHELCERFVLGNRTTSLPEMYFLFLLLELYKTWSFTCLIL